jgi:hypothetical protein
MRVLMEVAPEGGRKLWPMVAHNCMQGNVRWQWA